MKREHSVKPLPRGPVKFVYSRIQQICIKYYASGTSVRDTLGPVIEIAGVLLANYRRPGSHVSSGNDPLNVEKLNALF